MKVEGQCVVHVVFVFKYLYTTCIYLYICEFVYVLRALLFLFTQARVTLNAAMQIFLQLRPVDDAPRDVRRFRLHF